MKPKAHQLLDFPILRAIFEPAIIKKFSAWPQYKYTGIQWKITIARVVEAESP